jgi:hypothetical protein
VTYLLRLQLPGGVFLFVRRLHVDGRVSLTFDQVNARRFRSDAPAVLDLVRQTAAAWATSPEVAYLPAPG